MAFGSEPQNPVFKVLAEIQRYTDVCPNPGDSDLITCRAKRKDGGRCRNPPCTQYERHYSLDLLAEFRGMTECPDTDSFYNDLETYITYSHCKRWHRWPALAAFERWKKERIAARSNVRQRYTPAPRPVAPPARPSTPPPAIQPTTTTVIQPLTAAALQQLPFTPAPFVPSAASATSDGGNSFEDSILETRSVTSNGSTFLSSLPNTPPRNGLISVMEIDDIAEEVIIQEDGADWTAANAARAKTNADTSSSPSNKSITDVEMDTAEETVTQEDATDRISARAEKMMATMERIITILEKEKSARKEVSSKGKEVDRGDVVEEAAINKEAAVSNEAVISNESASVDTRKETITKREPEEKDNLNEGLESVAVEYKITRKALPKANDAEKMQHLALTSDIHDTVVTEENDAARETPVDGLGIISLQRNGSLRDHSPVFQVINSHPTAEKMREGVVYILEHKDNPSLFKIGWSSKSAEERLKQPNNCYGINTKVIYETKRFVGAPHAEKIAQVILRHANIRVLSCEQCKGGHREWFSAQGETVRQTVMQVEEFVQMPAYTLQDGDYKLSPEAYSRVVKQMCDFSIVKMGELIHGKTEVNEAAKSTIVLCETISLAPITPPETPRSSTRDGFFESQEANESLTSFSSQASKSKTRLSAGTKVARKLKHFVAAKNTVKEYLTRSRGSTPEVEGSDKRALGSVFLDLKDKARGLGTKARQDVREFRRDFKEELRRKNDDEAE